MNKENTQNTAIGINKPIMLLREEFVINLSNLINNSGLPLFAIEPIMREATNGVSVELRKQYEYEKAQYENAVKSMGGEQNDGRKISEEITEDSTEK